MCKDDPGSLQPRMWQEFPPAVTVSLVPRHLRRINGCFHFKKTWTFVKKWVWMRRTPRLFAPSGQDVRNWIPGLSSPLAPPAAFLACGFRRTASMLSFLHLFFACPIPTSHMFLVIVRWWYNRIPRLLISSTPGPWVQTIRTPLPGYCNGLRADPTLVLSNPIFPNSSESPKISRMLCPKHSTAFHFSRNKNWVLTLVKTPHGIWALLAL